MSSDDGQFNPPHPGEFIEEVFLSPFNVSRREVATRLGVSASTFSRLVAGKSDISPDMALRLEKVLGRSARSWLAMQNNYDLALAVRVGDHADLKAMEFAA